jgi:hypothetical protein
MSAATLMGRALHAMAPRSARHERLRVVIAAYLVVADEEYGRQIPFAFLERVRDEFQAKCAEKGKTAGANSLNKSFG